MCRQLASLSTKKATTWEPRHQRGWEVDHNLVWRPGLNHAAGFNQGKNDLLPGLCNPRGRSVYLLLDIRTPPWASRIGYSGNVTRSHAVDRPAGITLESKGTNGWGQLRATGIVAVFWGILHASIRLTTGISRPSSAKESPTFFGRGGAFSLLPAGRRHSQ